MSMPQIIPPDLEPRWTLGFGVRAEGMILISLIWMAVGLGASLGFAGQALPAPWDTLATFGWICSGLAAIALSFFPRQSQWGLAALVVLPIVRAVSYLWLWLLDLLPGDLGGDPRGWYRAVFYIAMIGLVVVLSHIPADLPARRK